MLGHVGRVGTANVVSAIGIGRVAAVVPPATSVLPGALFGGITGDPGSSKQGQKGVTVYVINSKNHFSIVTPASEKYHMNYFCNFF